MITLIVCIAVRSVIACGIGIVVTLMGWVLRLWLPLPDIPISATVPYTVLIPVVAESALGVINWAWFVISSMVEYGLKIFQVPGMFGWRTGLELGIGGTISSLCSMAGLAVVLDTSNRSLVLFFGFMGIGLLVGRVVETFVRRLVYTYVSTVDPKLL